jgi:hypothetical protein
MNDLRLASMVGTMKGALEILEIYSQDSVLEIIRGDAQLLENTIKEINEYVRDVKRRIELEGAA